MIKVELPPNSQSFILWDRNLTDFLKFVAALFVAFGHYCGYCSANKIHNVICDTVSIISPQFGYLGVAFFFLLSGYGLMMSDWKNHLRFTDFLKRRLSKIYLPAVLVSSIWLIINLVIDTTGG